MSDAGLAIIQKLLTFGPVLRKMTPREVKLQMLKQIASTQGLNLSEDKLKGILNVIREAPEKNVESILQSPQYVEAIQQLLADEKGSREVAPPRGMTYSCRHCGAIMAAPIPN